VGAPAFDGSGATLPIGAQEVLLVSALLSFDGRGLLATLERLTGRARRAWLGDREPGAGAVAGHAAGRHGGQRGESDGAPADAHRGGWGAHPGAVSDIAIGTRRLLVRGAW